MILESQTFKNRLEASASRFSESSKKETNYLANYLGRNFIFLLFLPLM